MRDDGRRRLRRRHDADIALRGEALHAALDECRDVGRELGTLRRRDRDDAGVAAFVQRQRGGEFRHRRLDGAAHQIGHQRAAALVGNVRDVGAGRSLEALERHVRRAADAASGHVDRLLLRQRDQFRQRLGLDLVVEDDAVRHVAGQRHRREVLERIVGKVRLHEGIDGERPVRADEQRVAVGRRVRHEFGADAAAGAAAVVDHNRLAERARNAFADDAADDVGVAAGGERHDQVDRPVGIGGEGGARQQARGRAEAEGDDQLAA